ncbi:SDR family NAD(P)-dependent oxidoreductase [Pimelobacter simplex]|uniref:3-oxoacyl-[acyl-carrier protein] reductase n=1 Tax=Nocardioides simplex TaxID=2045 RepID=A0A0A1DLI0_NOCSI|nr:SDR family oxidoreductase [Pimelobacter simplex]AIY18276.1 3-oxoacyl-[acyl-carrier protein] reductase [Pimelobacter simplex]MCG8153427.1 SDR family NAD(P)-dependent oxidoreductase [Pimelobacter simplex]GEB15903.1 putative short chain dehydrogenase/reductase [Pimelobacter simplex]SFN12596.1 NADP-dependent 3-hydroxy acid dehydrogenase YdfG [Pimelobacter simplex]
MTRPTPIDLAGAHVALTGGARGIGRATVEAFLARGAKVSFGDLDLDTARATAAATGASAHLLDVADRASYDAFVDAAEAEHGPVDVLVNNAGIMPNGAFLDMDPALDRLMMEVNVHGVLHGMRRVLPGMVERRRGHVVNVASLAGKFPIPGLAVYNASKFAVVGLTAATRLEMAPHGVTLTAVLPSAVDTDLASGLDMKPIPKVSPQRIADAVVGSVRSRDAEIAVPGYVGALAAGSHLVPVPVLDRFRRLMRDDRALHADTTQRAAYTERLADAATERTSR